MAVTVKKFSYPPETSPEQVLMEIKRVYSQMPSIGKIQSAFLRNGPEVFKFALIQEILDKDGSHHHNVLTLQTWRRYKGGWEEQDQRKIVFEDEYTNEIGLLLEFLNFYNNYGAAEKKTYGVLEQRDYHKFSKIAQSQVGDMIEQILEDANSYSALVQRGGLNLLKDILEWVMKEENAKVIVEKLQDMKLESLQEITAVAGITQLNRILQLWEENRNNGSEEFWQQTLTEYSWIISQLFSSPVILYNEKAYVGGKNIKNKGGNIVDYLYQNNLTANVSLIEIKTPCASLIGKEYRQTYSMSDEISGGIGQILNYKHQIQKSYIALKEAHVGNHFEVINPKALLIIGDISSIANDGARIEAFELYRQNLRDVAVITFDELFEKIGILKTILESGK